MQCRRETNEAYFHQRDCLGLVSTKMIRFKQLEQLFSGVGRVSNNLSNCNDYLTQKVKHSSKTCTQHWAASFFLLVSSALIPACLRQTEVLQKPFSLEINWYLKGYVLTRPTLYQPCGNTPLQSDALLWEIWTKWLHFFPHRTNVLYCITCFDSNCDGTNTAIES